MPQTWLSVWIKVFRKSSVFTPCSKILQTCAKPKLEIFAPDLSFKVSPGQGFHDLDPGIFFYTPCPIPCPCASAQPCRKHSFVFSGLMTASGSFILGGPVGLAVAGVVLGGGYGGYKGWAQQRENFGDFCQAFLETDRVLLLEMMGRFLESPEGKLLTLQNWLCPSLCCATQEQLVNGIKYGLGTKRARLRLSTSGWWAPTCRDKCSACALHTLNISSSYALM